MINENNYQKLETEKATNISAALLNVLTDIKLSYQHNICDWNRIPLLQD